MLHDVSADVEHGQTDASLHHMRQRQVGKVSIVGIEFEVLVRDKGIGAGCQVPVADHGSLGRASCAAGVREGVAIGGLDGDGIVVDILEASSHFDDLPEVEAVELVLVDKIPGLFVEWVVGDDVLDPADVLQFQQGLDGAIADEDGGHEGLVEAEGEVLNA